MTESQSNQSIMCYDTDGEIFCFHDITKDCGCECHVTERRISSA